MSGPGGRRVLVAGSYPPVPTVEAAATAAFVRELSAGGDEVEVLAPRPCAAHHSASFHSSAGARALARLARRFDVVIVRLEPQFPVSPRYGRWRRASALVALGLALGRARRAVVHVEDLAVVPRPLGGAAGGMVWRAADEVVVRSEAEAAELVGLTGMDRRRITVAPLPRAEPVELPDPGKLAPGAGREEVLLLVAARARVERARAAGLAGTGPAVDPLGPRTATLVPGLVRTALKRLLGPRAPAVAAAARRARRRLSSK